MSTTGVRGEGERGAATPARAIWLLDCDGVVNASRPGPGWGAPRSGMAYAYGEGWKLRWAPALVDRIRTWHRQGRVDVRWATTWCPYADQLEALWALPRLERALSDEEAATHASAAKLRAALAVVEHRPPTRLIWTDDEIPQDKEILHRLHAGPMPSLLIAPPANRGLSRADLDRIDQFLELANVTNGEHPA